MNRAPHPILSPAAGEGARRALRGIRTGSWSQATDKNRGGLQYEIIFHIAILPSFQKGVVIVP